MSEPCKFKSPDNSFFCRIIGGYCQFQSEDYKDGNECPIKWNYDNLEETELVEEK